MITSIITAQPDSPSSPVGGPDIKMERANDPLIIKDVCGGKSFKIVVGLPFNLRGLQSQPPHPPYKWEIGDGDRFVFKSFWPLSPNIDKLSATANIPTFASLVNNSDLGSEHGIVQLTDSDNHSTLSKDLIQNANKKVQVFYQKAETKYWNLTEPNWSYYWKQFIPISTITEIIYVQEFKDFASITNDDAKVILDIKTSITNTISSHKGLCGFYKTFAHEERHIQIFKHQRTKAWNYSTDTNKDCNLDNWQDESIEGRILKLSSSNLKAIYGFEDKNDTLEKYEETSTNPLKNGGTNSGFRWKDTGWKII